MKILVVTGVPDKPETTLLCGLARSGFEVLVAGEPNAKERGWLEQAGIKVVPFFSKRRIDVTAIRNVKQLIASFRPDIVYGFTGRGVTAMVIATMGKNLKRFAYRGVMGNLGRMDPASWLSFLNPSLNKISCVSLAVKKSLKEVGIKDRKLTVIYKGHDPKWYEGGMPRADREKYGIATDDFVVLCVANARPGKGVDDVISAVKKVGARIPIKLVLVGEIKDPQILSLLPDKRVVQLGSIPEAFRVVPLADCVVLASKKHEGLPKTIIEAMIQGVPPVVTMVGGMRELVRHEVDGLVLPPGNIELLKGAFEYLYEHPEQRAAFGISSRARILNDFSVEKTLADTLKMLSE